MIYNEILVYIDNLINNVEMTLQVVKEVGVEDFFKFVNLSIVESEEPFDRLIDFIRLNSTMKLCKLIVLVNPKAFLTDTQMVNLYRRALYNEVKIIVVDSNLQKSLLEYEK